MAIVFHPGDVFKRDDLNIGFDNDRGPINVADIWYGLYFVDPGPPEVEVPLGNEHRTPVNPSVGEYWAANMVPPDCTPGTYRIRWTFRELSNSPLQQRVMEFTIVGTVNAAQSSPYTAGQAKMIRSLRMLLRDQNPDKFYHFRPPEHQSNVNQYNRVFGQIWEDEELFEYLERALDTFNASAPLSREVSNIDLVMMKWPVWKTNIIWGAVTHACFALMANWIADSFDYSIGGVSLTLNKQDGYSQLMDAAKQEFDKAKDEKKLTYKIIYGLQQPKYGMGIKSAFGPGLAKGILSPRNFI